MDAVLLAAACPATAGDHVLDAGAGVGAVAACLLHRVAHTRAVLVEREAAYAMLARENMYRNRLNDRAVVVEADLTAPVGRTAGLANRLGQFDHVLANPPYFELGAGTAAADPLRAAAQAMPAEDLEAWVRFAAAMLKADGQLHMIHRTEALAPLLAALDGRFGAVAVHPVRSKPSEMARRLLVRATKGSRAPLTLAADVVVHASSGGFTPAIEAVLRHGAALELSGG
jgi:tRNA1(Val) A37 N6-methylase TrmN6